MKRWKPILLLFPAAVAVAVVFSGCYTQVGMFREDRQQEYTADEQPATEDTVSQEQYDDARQQFYYDSYNYYPSFSYGFGFYDPWYWRMGGYGYYNPYGYDPVWGWCGTSYPRYYGSWGNPSFSWNHPGHYTYRVGGNVAVRSGGPYGATRTFGSTRTAVGGTGSSAGVLPSGARATTGLGKGSTNVPLIPRAYSGRNANRPPNSAGAVGHGSGSRSSGNRDGVRSSGGNRSGSRRAESVRPYTPPPVHNPGNVSGGHSGGGQGSGGGGSAPASAPSGGSRAPTNTGQRGTERR